MCPPGGGQVTNDLMGKDYDIIVGPRNDSVIKVYLKLHPTVIFGWGGNVPIYKNYYDKRLNELKMMFYSIKPFCVGALSYGKYPRHGLMWNKNNRDQRELNWEELLK